VKTCGFLLASLTVWACLCAGVPGRAETSPAAEPDPCVEQKELRELLGKDGYALAVPAGEDLLGWARADLDGDGSSEVALRTCPGPCDEPDPEALGSFRLFKRTGKGWELEAELRTFFIPAFKNTLRKAVVGPDGEEGVLEEAFCGAHSHCLNLYRWGGGRYGAFEFGGSAGGVAVERDGTVAVGNRDYFTDPVANGWTGVYRWNGLDYEQESVSFGGPSYRGPSGAVRAYYNSIHIGVYARSFRPAYRFLSRKGQASTPYERFKNRFRSVARVAVDRLTVSSENGRKAVVEASVRFAREEVQGKEKEEHENVLWELLRKNGQWKLHRWSLP